MARFLDDRAGLSKADMRRLYLALRNSRDLAEHLRLQLVSDDLLSRALALDRQNFEAQIAKRVMDLRAEDGFNERVLSATLDTDRKRRRKRRRAMPFMETKTGTVGKLKTRTVVPTPSGAAVRKTGQWPKFPETRTRPGKLQTGTRLPFEPFPDAFPFESGVAGERPRRAAWWYSVWWLRGVAAAIILMVGLLIGRELGRLRAFDSAPARLAPSPAMATVVEAEGDLFALKGNVRGVITQGHTLASGEDLMTGRGSRAVVSLSDKTRLEMGAETQITWEDRTGADRALAEPRRGWAVHMSKGSLAAEVVADASKRTIVFTTPHAEALVTGTRLALQVDAASTHVDLDEGQLRLTCWYSGESIVLAAGQKAVVGTAIAAGAEPVIGAPALAGGQEGPLVLYAFGETSGDVVHDTSGIAPPLHLRIAKPDAVRWMKGGGLAVVAPNLIASTEPAGKLMDACVRSGELTVEAWIRSASVDRLRGPARIVTLSANTRSRNFTFGMNADPVSEIMEVGSYVFRLRTSQSDLNGLPALWTKAGVVRTETQHVVFTRDEVGAARFFVNGQPQKTTVFLQPTANFPGHMLEGNFQAWSPLYHLALANEFDNLPPPHGSRFWLGVLHRVAIYARALSEAEILENFAKGPHPGQEQAQLPPPAAPAGEPAVGANLPERPAPVRSP